MTKWHKTEDGLPTGGYYLTYQNGEMKLTKLTREFCQNAIPEGIASLFSHWMLLPEPPKESEMPMPDEDLL